MQDKAKKTAWLASLGAGLEYYDFIIYGMMASYLSPLFFPAEESWIGLLKVFGVFAIGYFVRPFGGLFFGTIGDVYGRKRTFLAVMGLMALSTFSIGLLPTYAQAGAWSPCLLIFMRILQGLSFGAELPGAITVVCENSQRKNQGNHTGYVISSVSIGAMLASFVLYSVSHLFSLEQISDWTWRLPFLLGGSLAFANYFIRKHMGETPEFTRLQAVEGNNKRSLQEPLLLLLQNHKTDVFRGIGLTWFVSSLVMFSLYFPSFLSQHFAYSSEDIYYAMTWGMVGSAVGLPIMGFISDKLGKKEMILMTCLGFLMFGAALFKMIEIRSQNVLIVFMVIYQTFISCLTVCFWPLLAGLFPTQVRYTGLAACYNITYSVMGCLPMVMTLLIQNFQTPWVGVGFLMGSAFMTALSCTWLKSDRILAESKFT